MSAMDDFSEEQKKYLEGFFAGQSIARAAKPAMGTATVPNINPAPTGPERIHFEARARTIAAGGKLVAEEEVKAKNDPFDMWNDINIAASEKRFPKGTDSFLWKYHGMFYVAPAQNSFMCRMRIPGGQLAAHQLRAVAALAEKYAGGYAHITTRANLQIRDIAPENPPHILTGLADAGLTSRGAGADNIRNITGSPTAGIDVQELIDTQPLCHEMHHYILNHRELFGLPRKFNIAFDGGGKVSCVDDTNDIGFYAVKVGEGKSVPAGIYYRLRLGGITGHKDFAQDQGVLLRPDECIKVADAILKVFIAHGDRTDRKRARMKYVLDKLGHNGYMQKVESVLANAVTSAVGSAAALPAPPAPQLRRLHITECEPRPMVAKHGHVGFHAQQQADLFYVGVVLPVGKVTVAQMRGIATIAEKFGSGSIRLTVWQNLIIADLHRDHIDAVKAGIEALGLAWQATSIRAGLIACTGNRGCKFSAADTKTHALQIADYVEPRITLDQPINIHLTGCHHSCAQHYIGDIGLIAAKVDVQGTEDQVEGYHVLVGGGYGDEQALAREVFQNIAADAVGPLVERMLSVYMARRHDAGETFHAFTQRHAADDLQKTFSSC